MRDIDTITFAGGTLDRAAHIRGDADALADFLTAATSKALLLWRGKLLTDVSNGAALVWLPMGAKVINHAVEAPIFLGLQNGAARFAYDISDWAPEGLETDAPSGLFDDSQIQHPDLPDTQKFTDVRAIMGDLSHADAGDAATVKGIFEWHKSHKFCANCGAASEVSKAGWQRHCPDCQRQHFPRTDPVVIMLITHGNDVLLGRSPMWPDGMYSLLAGFMEPGETISEAVRREVFEESAIKVGAVNYLLDQPWPFPSSLMIGCRGEALTRDITIDPVEMDDVLWISREDVMASMDGQNPDLRPARKGSIARFLLERWLTDTLD
ncbi:MAG: NAD(+) diphosphatase [Rhodobacteraceae bacterium]|nr:NAD(+) diphosphatase [Paracoccaceae bacterium]